MNRRGQDSWQIFKWFPRIFILTLIVVFCYYLFISYWTVDYDFSTARSASIHPKILYSRAFSNNIDCSGLIAADNNMRYNCAYFRPNMISLELFEKKRDETNESIILSEIIYHHYEYPTDTIVRVRTTPITARMKLAYEKEDETIEITRYYKEEDYYFYYEQYILSPRSYKLSYSHNSVIVIEQIDEYTYNRYEGILYIEVLAR